MNEPRKFLRKIIRMRKHTLRSGSAKKNHLRCADAIRKIEPWLNAFPNATPCLVAKFMYRHGDDIYAIMPGITAPNGEAIHNELRTIINKYTDGIRYIQKA